MEANNTVVEINGNQSSFPEEESATCIYNLQSNDTFKEKSGKPCFKRKAWTSLEADAVKRNLGYCIAMGRVPRKHGTKQKKHLLQRKF